MVFNLGFRAEAPQWNTYKESGRTLVDGQDDARGTPIGRTGAAL